MTLNTLKGKEKKDTHFDWLKGGIVELKNVLKEIKKILN